MQSKGRRGLLGRDLRDLVGDDGDLRHVEVLALEVRLGVLRACTDGEQRQRARLAHLEEGRGGGRTGGS